MSEERFETLIAELEDELDLRQREELAARLALSVDPIEPGPELRERLMERVERVEASRRRAAQRAWRSAGGLAAAAAVGAVVTGFLLQAPVAPADDDGVEVTELEALLSEQDQELAGLEGDLAEARDAVSVLLAERLERLDLAAAEGLEASARVYWDWDAYSCYFVADGLPAPAEGRTYVLWLTTDEGEVLRAGSFAAPGGRRASFFAMLPKDLGHVVSAAVTDEPLPPGDAPSGRPLLAGGQTRG